MKYYNINGEIIPKEQALIHVSDLGLHRGYSIFDYFRVRKGKAVFLEDYLDRFEYSAAKMLLNLPLSREDLKARIYELIAINEVTECGIKLILTGGYSEDGYTPTIPNLYILALSTIRLPSEWTKNGIKLMLHNYVRHIPSVKTTNYVESLLVREQLKSVQANDVLFCQNGYISESARSNFYIVTQDNTIVTSPDDILNGITRKHVLELAKKHYPLEIRPIQVEELKTAKEAFISSSAKGTLAVVRIDDWQIGDGKVGTVTKHLGNLYEAEVMEYINE